MTSPLFEAYGGATKLRKIIRDEIVSQLAMREVRDNYNFAIFITPASDAVIRKLRPKAKQRQHIYNYERDRAFDHWTKNVHINADRRSVALAIYDNSAKVMTINTNHHPVFVKLLIAEMTDAWPHVELRLQGGQTPFYEWQDEPSPTFVPRQPIFYDEFVTNNVTYHLGSTTYDTTSI
jgi:hypothetical protein